MHIIFVFFALLLINSFYWFKGTAKDLFGLSWTPVEWWVYTGLISNYASLHIWWLLLEAQGIWKATLISSSMACFINIVCNSYFYKFEMKYCISMILCFLALLISNMKS